MSEENRTEAYLKEHGDTRFISQLTRNTFAMVLAGGRGSRRGHGRARLFRRRRNAQPGPRASIPPGD